MLMNLSDCDMTQAVSHQLLLQKHGFDPRAVNVDFVVYTGCFTTLGHNCRR